MKLQLVNAPLPDHMSSCLRSSTYPPLNLLALSTFVKTNLPTVEVENLDGEILGITGILSKVNADVVGISCNSLSYESAVHIAEVIKQKNSSIKIILGGPHATQMYKLIIEQRSCFDIVVKGKGEYALASILVDKSLNSIPNCIYRDHDGNVIETEQQHIPLNKLPFPDLSLIQLEKYHLNFQMHYPNKKYKKGITTYSSSGCLWRIANDGGCIYCSIPDWKFSIVDPANYWAHIKSASQLYGIDFIWDVSDTFTSHKKWISKFAETKPKDLNVGFHVYARIDDLDDETITKLFKIGVVEMLVGIESYDDNMLNNANKGIDKENIKRTLLRLNDYGINVALSFVLGLPGESEQSLQNTLNELEKILWMTNITENHSSVMLPLPGSPIYDRMLSNDPTLKKKYFSTDIPDISALQWDYLEKYTECGAKTVFEYYPKIDSLFRSAGPFYLDKKSPVYNQLSYKEIITT